jgi:hypothetical protein
MREAGAPNVLMFADAKWDRTSTDEQYRRLHTWLDRITKAKARLVVIECGAGTSIATVRRFSERTITEKKGLLVRINVDEHEIPLGHIGIKQRALPALRALAARV